MKYLLKKFLDLVELVRDRWTDPEPANVTSTFWSSGPILKEDECEHDPDSRIERWRRDVCLDCGKIWRVRV